MTQVILPGATLGVLGGGQLGRMFTVAAKRLGYRVVVLTDETDSPAAQLADESVVASYDDVDAASTVARKSSVITLEFENISLATVRAAAELAPCRPGPEVIEFAQDRLREKQKLQSLGIPTVPFAAAEGADEVSRAAAEVGFPCIVKTARSGYDGKGQSFLKGPQELADRLGSFDDQQYVVEGVCDFLCEFSVVAARSDSGEIVAYDPPRNEHVGGILDLSYAPSGLPAEMLDEAREIMFALLDAIDYVGVGCLEFFAAKDGKVLVNELAPRPHNSGHWTIEACPVSQFEQQVRAICGLPLGGTRRRAAAAMANLMGDLWSDGEPNWERALATTDVALHLYGKGDPRPGRKMGHLTFLADQSNDVETARLGLLSVRAALAPGGAG